MAQARPGIAHGVAELVAEEGEQDDGGRDLQAGEQARPRLQRREDALQPGFQPGSRAHTSPAPPGPVFVPTTAPSGATSSITACGRALRTVSAMSFAMFSAWACATPTRSRSSGARVLADEALELGQQARVAAHAPERLDLALDQREQRPHAEQAADERLPAADAPVALEELERLEREHEARAPVEASRPSRPGRPSAQGPASSCRAMPSAARASPIETVRVSTTVTRPSNSAAARRAELTVAESASERCSESTCS